MSEEKRLRIEELYREGRRLAEEEERLIKGYRSKHDLSYTFGIIDTPEVRAIREKEKLLYKEICELRDA